MHDSVATICRCNSYQHSFFHCVVNLRNHLPSDTGGGGAAIAQSITEPTRLPHASFKHVWTLFYQHLTMHCLFLPVFTNVLYFYMNVISSTPLLRIFYSLSNHNYNRIRTARQYLESLAHPTGMHFNGRQGRKGGIYIML